MGVAAEAGVVTKVAAAAWTLTNLLKKRYSSLTAGFFLFGTEIFSIFQFLRGHSLFKFKTTLTRIHNLNILALCMYVFLFAD